MIDALKTSLRVLAIATLLIKCSPDDEQKITPVPTGQQIFHDLNITSSTLGAPEITLHNAIDKVITIDNNNFRPHLDELKMINGSSEISGEIVMSDDKLTIYFFPNELLPEHTSLIVSAKAHWERQDNGSWVTVDGMTPEVLQKNFSTVGDEILPTTVKSVFPASGAVNQSIVTNPRVTFAFPLSEPIDLTVTDVRAVFKSATLTMGNALVVASTELDESNRYVEIIPENFLEGQKEYQLSLEISWERKQLDTWKPITRGGVAITETPAFTFTTGVKGNTSQILTDNIEYSYPVANQYHFLKLEHNTGFLKLKRDLQNELFNATGVQFKARFTTQGQDPLDVSLTFDPSTLTATHSIPNTLQNETIYKLEFLKVANGSGNTEVLHTKYFRTSMYDTFLEKINSYSFNKLGGWQLLPIRVDELQSLIEGGSETFDEAEADVDSVDEITIGAAYAAGLIKIDLLPETEWYATALYQTVYSGYKAAGLKVERDTTFVGVHPLNASYIAQYNRRALTSAEVQSNSTTRITDYASLRCTVPPYAAYDWISFRNQAANHPDRETNPYLKKLLEDGIFPSGIPGTYVFRIKYVLPNGQTTSEVTKDLLYSF